MKCKGNNEGTSVATQCVSQGLVHRHTQVILPTDELIYIKYSLRDAYNMRSTN